LRANCGLIPTKIFLKKIRKYLVDSKKPFTFVPKLKMIL
jgi:hypothetical protein